MSTTQQPVATSAANRVALGRWLALWSATVFILVLVGGGTRLTESGLSITEWKPFSGVIPPIGDAAWAAEFEKYKQIPQYAQMNAGMTLSEFKGIFLWEYVHRLLARMGGLVFAIPFFWFWLRGRIPRVLMPRIVMIGTLLIAQAALGWYMVASGLVERVTVSQYRLAAHLSLALVLYCMSVWTADELLSPNPGPPAPRVAAALKRLIVLIAVTIVAGAFVAGLRAGKIYNEFPLMGQGLAPVEYGQLTPWWRNWFDNPAAAQFNHRLIATATLLAVAIFWARASRATTGALRQRVDLMAVAVLVQFALGITVLLLSVPVIVGVAHQAGALLLLTAALMALRTAMGSAQQSAS
ncbi:MAG: heme A synthase [Gemmatimonadetes bacterium]|nr:heme A synthase [Gemmatimonadota bacterium]